MGVVERCFMDRLVAVAVYSCQRHLFQRSAAAAAAAVDNGDESNASGFSWFTATVAARLRFAVASVL